LRDFEFSRIYEDDEGAELSYDDQLYVLELITQAKVHFDFPEVERTVA
jgi:hypothetical protein